MNGNFNDFLVCSKCGATNASNTKFCIRCGNPLQTNINGTVNGFSNVMGQTTNLNQQNYNNVSTQQTYNNSSMVNPGNGNEVYNNVVQPNNVIYNNYSQSVMTNGINTNQVVSSVGNLNYLQYIIGAVLKPFDNFKKDEENLNSFKNSGILSIIIVGLMTIVSLFKTMLDTVRVTSIFSDEVKWVWENLKEIKYFKTIGQSLLLYIGILIAISGVYFLASLVIKKDAKFPKLLGATATAFIPFALATSILSPIVSLIYSPLGICITAIGFIYMLVILLELINELILLENKNSRIYFHLTCLSVIVIGGGLIAYKLVLGSLTSGLLNFFG